MTFMLVDDIYDNVFTIILVVAFIPVYLIACFVGGGQRLSGYYTLEISPSTEEADQKTSLFSYNGGHFGSKMYLLLSLGTNHLFC